MALLSDATVIVEAGETSGTLHQGWEALRLGRPLFLDAEVLGPGVTLVPAPKGAPLVKGALWPAQRICQELTRQGLGQEILPCVRRVTAAYRNEIMARGLFEEHGVLDLSACHERPAGGEIVSVVPNHCCVVSNMVDEV